MKAIRILFIDDDRALCEWVAESLGRRDIEVVWQTDPKRALEQLAADSFEIVIADVNMPGVSGLTLCERIASSRPDVPVIVITAFGSLETAIAAIRAGAYDFVTKPFDIEVLTIAVRRAAGHRALREEVKRLRLAATEEAAGSRPPGLIGDSRAMAELRGLVRRLARSEASVLIGGESGTGKEVVARAIHAASSRGGRPFVAINCAAVPAPLLEAELFGHVRGAFTDAKTSRVGLFFEADKSTLFLDEIGDMPLDLQPKLLRALEQRAARPVGGNSEVGFDVRLIAATNRDLMTAVDEGRFREDLYYRLNVIQVDVPPLRARGGDVLVLAQHFIEQLAGQTRRAVRGLSQAAAERMLAYAWPGNVRELRNCIERAVALAQFEDIMVEDLPERIRAYRPTHVVISAEDPSQMVTLEELERRYIFKVLESTQDNKTAAARILGLDRATLYRKLERYQAPARRGPQGAKP